MDSRPRDGARVPVWDLPIRLFHWTLALLVAGQWMSYTYAEAIGDVTLEWHRAGGLVILILLVWRVLWGFAGSSPVLFKSFVRRPAVALRYARDVAAGRSRRYLGHNPLGAWMVLALLTVLVTQASLGLFAVDDNDLTGGPLHRLVSVAANARATIWHRRVFEYAILPLVAVHVVANVLYGTAKKEPLITAMITGSKPAGSYEDVEIVDMGQASIPRALLRLVIAAASVLGSILAVGGRL